jgi:hypothetical protein
MGLFLLLAMLPGLLPLLHLNLHPSAPKTSYGVQLMTAPVSPRAVKVAAPATPVKPDQPPATLPAADTAREAAMVAAEDKRLRTVLHTALRAFQPQVVSVRGSLPTLVLTAGQVPYTAKTLVEYGAMVLLPHNAALLVDNVFVSTNATLQLGSANLRTLYLDSGAGGFATIVGYGGNLKFQGTASKPMTIMGWDRAAAWPAKDEGYGRSYIREVGGVMTLSEVRATSLGFWSGRTGGVAWTGLSNLPSSGGATSSTFTSATYGAFVSRGDSVRFTHDLFEFNQVDGLRVHRLSADTKVVGSAAVRNGANGFSVSPATSNTTFLGDLSEHNGGNGFQVNGRPLATTASASGGSVAPGTNTTIAYSSSFKNGKIGILIDGGQYTVVKGDQVCGGTSGIEVRHGSSDAVVTGNTIGCSPRSGIELGPSTPGAVVDGNSIDGPRTGILINSSGTVQLDKNTITNASVFGISGRGATTRVIGVANTISGTGFRAVDYRALAPPLSLSGTHDQFWQHRAKVTVLNYLQFHPLAALWLGIATLLVLAWACSRRKRPWHPYPHSTRWRREDEKLIAASTVPAAAWDMAGSSMVTPERERPTPEFVGAAASAGAPVPPSPLWAPVAQGPRRAGPAPMPEHWAQPEHRAPVPHRPTFTPSSPPPSAPESLAPVTAQLPEVDVWAPETTRAIHEPAGGGTQARKHAKEAARDADMTGDPWDAAWQPRASTPRHDSGESRPPWDTMPMPTLRGDS